jgi:hypothetical protein
MYSTHRWINKYKHSALCLFLRNQLSCADQNTAGYRRTSI